MTRDESRHDFADDYHNEHEILDGTETGGVDIVDHERYGVEIVIKTAEFGIRGQEHRRERREMPSVGEG